MAAIEVRVPNIGDFKDVPVIEVLVKPGDVVKAEDPLITVESEKASMEVPSPSAGKVESVKVKVGDKISEGSAILTLSGEDTTLGATSGNGTAQQQSAQPQAAQPVGPSTSLAASAASSAQGDKGAASSAQGDKGEASPRAPSAVTLSEASAASAVEAPTGQTIDVAVPDIGDFTDVPVIEVLVKTGDSVQKESPLVTLESEKASIEVPSPQAGTVKDVVLKVGDKVSKGTKILRLEIAGAPPSAQPSAPSAPQAAEPVVPSTSLAASAVSGVYPERSRGAQGDSGKAPAQTSTPSSVAAPGHVEPSQAAPAVSGGVVHASPSIRRFARELGVDLAQVKGSGPNARVTREDVQSFVKRALAEPRAAAGAMPFNLPPWPKLDFAQFGATERVPLSRIKKISGPILARNWVMIPHVTNHEEADITDLEEFRKHLNVEYPQVKVTMLAFLIKAVVAALQHFPDLNSSLAGDSLILKKYYNIGFAADTPNGLLVPVIKNADEKGLLIVARETRELAAKARDGKLSLAEMQGASFTISSLGGIGGTGFTPIVNAPEVAILGVSRSTIRPVWNGTEFGPRLILPLSLSYDHRVVDGAQAARFNDYLAGVLGDMRRAML
jgi:pyruvate dehydrogenase E2 component (dihydrolipoamide acetyltransferase)